MTFLVPTSAASVKGISSSYHGVFTSRSAPFSSWPAAPFTMKPTQSIKRTLASMPSSKEIFAASFGMNFGSVVMMVFPAALWGSSSLVWAFWCSSVICGMTRSSMNRLMNVDFPVRTGPTTPM